MTTPEQQAGQPAEPYDYKTAARQIIELEAIIAVAAQRKAAIIAAGQADAVADLIRHQAAPTRHTEYGTFTLPVTKPAVELADSAALLAWAEKNHPGEVEVIRQVRPSFTASLVKNGTHTPEGLLDPKTGELVPGFEWREGGQAKTLTLRKNQEKLAAAVTAIISRFDALAGELPAAIDQQVTDTRYEQAAQAAQDAAGDGLVTVERAQKIGAEIAGERSTSPARDLPAASRREGPFATTQQLTRTHTLLSLLGYTERERDKKLTYLSRLVGRALETSRALTRDEVTQVNNVLGKLVAERQRETRQNAPDRNGSEVAPRPAPVDPWDDPTTAPQRILNFPERPQPPGWPASDSPDDSAPAPAPVDPWDDIS